MPTLQGQGSEPMNRRKHLMLMFVMATSVITVPSFAADDCCDTCGCSRPLTRICRPVYTTKREQTSVWDSVCQEYCLPQHVRPVVRCDDCCTAPQACEQCQACEKEPRTRNRLIRKQYVERVPTILWVTEYRCDDCAGQHPKGAQQPMPPTPLPTAEVKPVSTWQWLWELGKPTTHQ
jgi:hypothetical protein